MSAKLKGVKEKYLGMGGVIIIIKIGIDTELPNRRYDIERRMVLEIPQNMISGML